MSEDRPHLLTYVRTDAGKHLNKSLCIRLGAFTLFIYRVNEYHHLRNSCVECKLFKILSDLFNALVVDLFKRGNIVFHNVFGFGKECPHTVQEAFCAFNSLIAPRLRYLKRTHKHLVKTERIRTVLTDNVAWIYNKFRETLTHLYSVRAKYHSLMHELFEGLFGRSDAFIVKISVPDSRIHKMTYRMLGSAYVKVNGHPMTKKLWIGKRLVVIRIYIAKEVPA